MWILWLFQDVSRVTIKCLKCLIDKQGVVQMIVKGMPENEKILNKIKELEK